MFPQGSREPIEGARIQPRKRPANLRPYGPASRQARRDRPIAADRRTTLAVSVSLVAHLVLVVALARHAPFLRTPMEEAGPPEPIIPVLLMPRALPPSPGRPEGTTIRLHRRPQRFAPHHVPPPPEVAPVVLPQAPKPAPPPPGPSPAEIQRAEVRQVLRRGVLGCANPDAAGLTREERDRCNERFARGAASAPQLGLGLNPEAAADLDRAQTQAARRAAPPPVGVSRGIGRTASDMVGAR